MDSSTARKLRQVPADYLLVGIDPHKQRHAAAIMTPEARVVSRLKVDNSRPGFQQLRVHVEQEVRRHGYAGAMYAIESGSHFWRNLAYFLQEQGQLFRTVSPYTLKRRREGDDLDLRKNDYRDAAMAADLLRTGKFTETQLPTGAYAELRAAYQAYRRVQRQRSRTLNLLQGLLDGVFPEFRRVFKYFTGKMALTVLALFPDPAAIRALEEPEFVRQVCLAYPGRRPDVDKLHALYAAAQTSVGVRAGARVVALEILHLLQHLERLADQVMVWEQELRQLIAPLPETPYLLSIHGIGPLTVAGLLGELGPFHHYRNAKQLIKMAGTNPTESESAGHRSPSSHMSKKGRSGLRWCLWMASVSLLRHNPDFVAWARARKERPSQANPLTPKEVLGAVNNRLLRIAFGLVKHQTTYQLPCLQPAAA